MELYTMEQVKKRTIIQAIIDVLTEERCSLSVKAIYNKIVGKEYYIFKAQNPYNVVRVELRRHCIGIDFPSAQKKKYFQILNDGTYSLLQTLEVGSSNTKNKVPVDYEQKCLLGLRELHQDFTNNFKEHILTQLKDIDPEIFEVFCKRLLMVYGFKDFKVTRAKRDGGIDGFGKLKVGISYLNVAVQCKRWNKTSIGRTEIDKFRGAIQGDFEQGIFMTTSKFSKEALSATTKKGAVPIILIDGSMIVDIMIEKRFGIDIENLPVYINALDEVLGDE